MPQACLFFAALSINLTEDNFFPYTLCLSDSCCMLHPQSSPPFPAANLHRLPGCPSKGVCVSVPSCLQLQQKAFSCSVLTSSPTTTPRYHQTHKSPRQREPGPKCGSATVSRCTMACSTGSLCWGVVILTLKVALFHLSLGSLQVQHCFTLLLFFFTVKNQMVHFFLSLFFSLLPFLHHLQAFRPH